MPLQATSGAASYDAFGGGAAAVPQYIEDVFSTYLYTGDGSTQTITNGIDLSGKGGLVWLKPRDLALGHILEDTGRGIGNYLRTNTAAAQTSDLGYFQSVNSNGFTLTGGASNWNQSTSTYASWTFRKQPKFFDIVTYTGNGTSSKTVSHSLGSVPGCIIVKKTSAAGTDWSVYHRSLGNNALIYLNYDNAVFTPNTEWATTTPTSTSFFVNGVTGDSNTNGATYVAYLFAHDAGGFGLTGTDNVISCGSFTTDGSGNATVSLGYEPQWFLVKKSSSTGNWFLTDTMQGFTAPNPFGADTFNYLSPNLTDAEGGGDLFKRNSTGFSVVSGVAADTYIYIAIRLGPMKIPTLGTSVFGMSARTGTSANATVTGGQTDDAVLVKNRGSAIASLFASRLTGKGYLVTSSTAAEVSAGVAILQANPWDVMDGVKVGTTSNIINSTSNTYINYLFKRAPSFFDEVCYTGTGSSPLTVNHNLGVVPELVIIKYRSQTSSWKVLYSFGASDCLLLSLNGTAASATSTYSTSNDFASAPTNTQLSFGDNANISSATIITYLFATCAGVSKVGSYTGNGTTQTIDCGLTAGARFVLIKRTDAVGSWYVYDTARGMTVLTDPYWLTNTTAAEVATLGSVTTVATGFALNSAILAAINVNAGTYIFLAIA